MELNEKVVDGFRFLPPGLKAWVKTFIPDEDFKGTIPWKPMSKPLNQTTIALVTSAGISLKSGPLASAVDALCMTYSWETAL